MADRHPEIALILAGERGAFEQFVRKYERLVSHVVFRMVQSSDDRQDLCQEVFMSLYRNLDSFRQESKLSTWIGRIAHNKCLNFLEKKQLPLYDDISGTDNSIERVAADQQAPDERTASVDASDHLRAAIDRLPVMYGTILALYHLEGMPYKEIGDIMNLPDGTVKSYLFRGRKLLKEQLVERYRPEDLWL